MRMEPHDGDEFEICDAQERRASTPTSIYMDTLHYVEPGCTYLALRAWAQRVLIEVTFLSLIVVLWGKAEETKHNFFIKPNHVSTFSSVLKDVNVKHHAQWVAATT